LRYARAVSLLGDPDAFFTDHRRCGDLDAGVEGEVVWIACRLLGLIAASSRILSAAPCGGGRARYRDCCVRSTLSGSW
jgi:hypothetical protein